LSLALVVVVVIILNKIGTWEGAINNEQYS